MNQSMNNIKNVFQLALSLYQKKITDIFHLSKAYQLIDKTGCKSIEKMNAKSLSLNIPTSS